MELINWVIAHGTQLLELFLAVLGVASIVAKLTPTKVDDKALQVVVDIVHKLGLTK